MGTQKNYDVIVVGGGHAGTEAALVAARIGVRTLLLTHNIDALGQMSCNPAIGGIGKGHLVKEIDAMGGMMAWAADQSGIHFRILNASKGPAVRATRAQIDRSLYRQAVTRRIQAQHNLQLFQQEVADLIVNGDEVRGVLTQMGLAFYAPCVVLAAGTFLGGKIHIGKCQQEGGRAGDSPSNRLAQRLRELPFRVGRLKTGTPPRLDANTIDYAQCMVQPGDDPRPVFSFLGSAKEHPMQMNCHISRTNEKTHAIIRQALHHSPVYNGDIAAAGPRYCPSVEDKVARFPERNSHQIFIEPEGLNSREIYPNGISTSLPYEIQEEVVHSIAGFEQAHITRPGYAIEYDYFDPRDLYPWLETRCLQGLFFAGQINGTTGYEEAAAQGLLAGINAARRSCEQETWFPQRSEAYLGVMTDDLTTCGTIEPYRMFTSRAEYRLLLREDNADLRLTEQAFQMGLISDDHWQQFVYKKEALEKERARLSKLWFSPGSASEELSALSGGMPDRQMNAWQLLSRPNVSYASLADLPEVSPGVKDAAVAMQLEYQAHYAGYIERQKKEVARQYASEQLSLQAIADYTQVTGISNEVAEQLNCHRPVTLGQASRIPGVTPAALSLLRIWLKKHSREQLPRSA